MKTFSREGEDSMEPTDSPTAPTVDAAPQHTPGPWRVTVNGGFADGQPHASVWIEAGTYTSLASLIPVREVQANGRLMAAAPDLLAALKALASFTEDPSMPCDSTCEPGCIWCAVSAAIAKAEGRSDVR